MQEPARTVIGYIVDVQGDALTAALVEDEQGHAPTVTIGDEDIVVGRIGSYVVKNPALPGGAFSNQP